MAAHDHSKPEGSGIFLTDDPEAFGAEFFGRIPLVILGFRPRIHSAVNASGSN
jgi:hypothetical protein